MGVTGVTGKMVGSEDGKLESLFSEDPVDIKLDRFGVDLLVLA